MINYKEAIEMIRSLEKEAMRLEQIELIDSLGRTLANNLFADTDMPPFDKSAMDGYACKRSDLKTSMQMIENVPAGKTPLKQIMTGQCSKVMTGAKIPAGADCVIKIEDIEIGPKGEVKFKAEETKNNICYQSEDIKKGDLVLAKGTRIQTQDLAILASFGCMKPLVYAKPSIGILCSGTELVEPEEKPDGVSIRSSNAYQLLGQAQTAGAITRYYGIVSDDEALLEQKIDEMLSSNEVAIITGGASVGDYDFIEDIFKRKGFSIHFTQTAIQTGKPAIFASTGKKYCIGLSGNPVSSYLQFELYVRPLLAQICGQDYQLPIVELKSAQDIKSKKNGRNSFVPVKLNPNGWIEPIEFHGSAHLAAMSEAFGFAILGDEKNKVEKGDSVQVIMINTK